MPRTKRVKRKRTPANTETAVLSLSRRRCCICFGLHKDFLVKPGQIAHLDHDPSNFALDNLAWLCLVHHDEYDTKRSQSKNMTIGEVKKHRTQLYKAVKAHIDRVDRDELRERDLRTLRKLFEQIYTGALDTFFETGKDGFFDFEIFIYNEGFSALVQSTNFHIYDEELRKKVELFYQAWNRSLSHGNHFFTDKRSKSRFEPISEFASKKEFASWNRAHLKFLRDLYAAEQAFRAFLKHVKENYKELDIDETNKIALAAYRSFMEK